MERKNKQHQLLTFDAAKSRMTDNVTLYNNPYTYIGFSYSHLKNKKQI
jgi:hypothetical protein